MINKWNSIEIQALQMEKERIVDSLFVSNVGL